MNDLTITVPAERKWILALRTTIGACGSIAGLSLDTISDLRLAIDEGFDLLSHQPRKLEKIRMDCSIDQGMLHIKLQGIRSEKAQTCAPQDPQTAKLIIGTLVTDIHLEGDSCGIHSMCLSISTGEEVNERG
ncbi:MAG: hypothetical protein Q4E07_04675 [Eubacteriales bacterium]|nr:hypothetical protein [Eubacteriales bacterium]